MFFLASIREVTKDSDAAKDEGIVNIVSHCCYSPGPLYSLTLLPYDLAPAVNKDLPALTLVFFWKLFQRSSTGLSVTFGSRQDE